MAAQCECSPSNPLLSPRTPASEVPSSWANNGDILPLTPPPLNPLNPPCPRGLGVYRNDLWALQDQVGSAGRRRRVCQALRILLVNAEGMVSGRVGAVLAVMMIMRWEQGGRAQGIEKGRERGKRGCSWHPPVWGIDIDDRRAAWKKSRGDWRPRLGDWLCGDGWDLCMSLRGAGLWGKVRSKGPRRLNSATRCRCSLKWWPACTRP